MKDLSEKIAREISYYYTRAAKKYHEREALSDDDYAEFNEALAENLRAQSRLSITSKDIRSFALGELFDLQKVPVICDALVPKGEPVRDNVIRNILFLTHELHDQEIVSNGDIPYENDHARRDRIARRHAEEFAFGQETIQAYRQYTPQEAPAGAKSFPEILEIAFQNGEDPSGFVDRLTKEWQMPQAAIERHIDKVRAQTDRRISSSAFLTSFKNAGGWVPETIENLVKDFGFYHKKITESPGEIMFWRLRGKSDFNSLRHVNDRGETHLEQMVNQGDGDCKKLLEALIDASGIPRIRLEKELPSIGGILKNGTRPESVAGIIPLVETLNPPGIGGLPPERIHAQNVKLVEAISGRKLDLDAAIKTSSSAVNQGAALFTTLFGRTSPSLVAMTREDLQHALYEKGIELDTNRYSNMRVATKPPQAYSQIPENLARALLEIFRSKTAYIVKKGYMPPITNLHENRLINTLTNSSDTKTLFAQCKQGNITPAEMLQTVGRRRGASSARSVAISISAHFSPRKPLDRSKVISSFVGHTIKEAAVSKFFSGDSVPDNRNALAMGLWMGLNLQEARQYSALARGKAVTDSDSIMDQVQSGTLSPKDGLNLLFDSTGLTVNELAARTGVDRNRISYALGNVEPGIIMCDPLCARNVACELGLEHRVRDFKQHFWRTNKRAGGKNKSNIVVVGEHTGAISSPEAAIFNEPDR